MVRFWRSQKRIPKVKAHNVRALEAAMPSSIETVNERASAFAVVLAVSLGCDVSRRDYEDAVDVLVGLLEDTNDMVPKVRHDESRVNGPDVHGGR